jgi:REP element-mobilizing transposase RayT
VTLRGNDGTPVFLDDHDRRSFLSIMGHAGQLADWRLLSYCLMTNHVHMLVRLGPEKLSLGMHAIGTTHSHRFNKIHERTGHLFGDRYYSKVVEYDEHLALTFRYIALNPWRAGLVQDHDRWPWSAHAALAGLGPAHRALDRDVALEYFDGSCDRYREFVAEGKDLPERPPLADLTRSGELRLAIFHGYTQEEIAEELRVSQPTVFRLLRHETATKLPRE